MRIATALRSGVLIAGVVSAAMGLRAQAPTAIIKAEGLPARATPADYQAHAQAGALTVAAEFTGHSVAAPDGNTLTTEDYVAVEVALFGPPGTKARVSFADFSLRLNGKKTPLPSQATLLVFKSLKDPELEPTASEQKSKTSINTGGQPNPDSTPAPVHIPIEVRRGWQQRVEKASLPEGERNLPQAGLIFFQYHGKTDKLQSIELIYDGPNGKATLALQP